MPYAEPPVPVNLDRAEHYSRLLPSATSLAAQLSSSADPHFGVLNFALNLLLQVNSLQEWSENNVSMLLC